MNRIIAVMAAITVAAAVPVVAQTAPQAKGDPREAIALSAPETETLLSGMRTYLETIQGIVAAMAENQTARVPEIASRAGAKLLQDAKPSTGFKVPLGFSSMSFDTHDKFDKLADKAKKGASRSVILTDLRDIMGNCISCHAAYRLAK
jgi:cytochrome c556